MSVNLYVEFEYEPSGSDSLPEDQRIGVGATVVTAEREPVTSDEWREVARTIGTMRTPEKTEDYLRVAIRRIAVVDVPESDDVLEGEIVV